MSMRYLPQKEDLPLAALCVRRRHSLKLARANNEQARRLRHVTTAHQVGRRDLLSPCLVVRVVDH